MTGRGGWTWYTGSAGWLYRAAVEGILGIRRRGDRLIVDPVLPSGWDGFSAMLDLPEGSFDIRVERSGPDRAATVTVNKTVIKDIQEGYPL